MKKALITIILASTLFITDISSAQQNQNGNSNININNYVTSNIGVINAKMNESRNADSTANIVINKNSNVGGSITSEVFTNTNLKLQTKGPRDVNLKLLRKLVIIVERQLVTSRMASQKATNKDVKAFAEVGITEQEALMQKIRKIAPKGFFSAPRISFFNFSLTKSFVDKVKEMPAGTEFDRLYIKKIGVKGHKKLEKLMTKVQTKGTNTRLRALADMELPIVRQRIATARNLNLQMHGMKK